MRWSGTRVGRGGAPGRRVLGVDPGTVVTGWGVVEDSGRALRHVASGTVRPRGVRAERLAVIYRALCQLCERFAPVALSLEQTFVGENIQTAFRLGEARGAVMVAAAGAGLPVVEYTPAEIKVAVAGSGRAPKEHMQAMVGRLLGVEAALAVDEADALGAAICHAHSSRFAAQVAAQAGKNGRRRRASPRLRRSAFRR